MSAMFNERPWDRATASHLLSRAGFGGSPEEIDAATKAGFEAVVSRLLELPKRFPQRPEAVEPINVLAEIRMIREKRPDAKKKIEQLRQMQFQATISLAEWWVEEMRNSRYPLLEKMTLFWHGHFATSIQKVKNPYAMWQQNDTLRRNALGSFEALTKSISRDPAMIIWLDLQQSGKAHPNENFARELLELFMLGEGNYTEEDVMEAARAFTGYRTSPDGEFRIARFQQDDGPKTFMGKTAETGDDIIDIVLKQKQCARFIAAKLWTFFAYENPEPELIDRLAARFRRSSYDIRELMFHIFTSPEFYSEKAMGTQIKSPLQWIVQLTRQLHGDLPPKFLLVAGLRQLGQMPFSPPSVKGWDGGKAWVSTSALLQRYNFAKVMLGDGSEALGGDGKLAKLAARRGGRMPALNYAHLAPKALRQDPILLVQSLTSRLFNIPLPKEVTATFVDYAVDHYPGISDENIQSLLHLMVSTPYYQLT